MDGVFGLTFVIIYPGFCVEFFFKREKTALLRYTNKEYAVCQLADIAVTSKGCGTRLSGGVAGGDDEQTAAVEEGLQVCRNGLVDSSCHHEDDGLLSLDEEIPDVLLQSAVETADDASPFVPHLHRPVIALQHHLDGDGA